jgi:hypothetical protein
MVDSIVAFLIALHACIPPGYCWVVPRNLSGYPIKPGGVQDLAGYRKITEFFGEDAAPYRRYQGVLFQGPGWYPHNQVKRGWSGV